MINIFVKYPDGKWVISNNTEYQKDAEKMYAKALVGLYRNLLQKGHILCFTIEIQTTSENEKHIQVIGYGGM